MLSHVIPNDGHFGEKEVFNLVFHIIFSDKANMEILEMGEKINFLYGEKNIHEHHLGYPIWCRDLSP